MARSYVTPVSHAHSASIGSRESSLFQATDGGRIVATEACNTTRKPTVLRQTATATETTPRQTQQQLTTMDPLGLLLILVIGGIAGWLAGQFMEGRGFGVAGNVIVGILGALLGGLLLPLGFLGIIGSLISATAVSYTHLTLPTIYSV